MYQPIVKEESKWNTKGRNILINVAKKDKEEEEWPRITKEKVKNQHITVDWAKYKDPDDSGDEDKKDDGMGDFDPTQMQNMMGGGIGGMGGMGGGMPGLTDHMGEEGADDSDEEEGEEAQVDPHLPGQGNEKKEEEEDLDDLDGDEEGDLKK